MLYESLVINDYLAETYDSPCRPADPLARAQLRLVVDYLDSTVNPAFFTFFMNKDPDAEPPLRAAFEATLDNLEQDLATHGGPYLCGSAYSLADVSGLPFFERMAVALPHWKGWAFDGARHPKLVAWMALVFQREAFQKVQLGDAKIIETYQKFRDMDYKFGGLAKGK